MGAAGARPSPMTTSAPATCAHRRLRDRAAPRHQRQLAALQRGRRLRAARVVVGRGLGVEGGVRHHPPSLRGGRRAQAPVCHVSWFEADAFARAHGARLPTRGGVGAGGDLGARAVEAAHTHGVGQVWEWTSQPLRRLPRVRRPPLPRVLRGVLRRGLPRVARRLVGHAPARGESDLPQLGPPAATPDLRGRAAGEERYGVRGPSRDPQPSAIQIDSHLGGAEERTLAEDVLDGLTRPFKELPPKHFYDARGAELFDRICELPEYYPTRTERGILDATAGEMPRSPAPSSWWSWARAPLPRRACCSTPCTAPARSSATCRWTSPRAWCATARDELTVRVPRPARARGDRRLRAPPRPRAPRRRPAPRGVPRRHHRQLPPRQPPALPAPDRRRCSGRGTTC